MITKQHIINIEEYTSIEDLTKDDAALLKLARETTADAYAPYSDFQVAGAARLVDGTIVTGTNQENASYPVGICAERVLLGTIATQHKDVAIDTIAISYHNLAGTSSHPVAPCGMCRQSLVEFENRVNRAIRLILSGQEGKVFIIPAADMLLPLAFLKSELIDNTSKA
jgi:cytidine deaminase